MQATLRPAAGWKAVARRWAGAAAVELQPL